jgi:enolase-phosphatase E1
MIGAVLCDIEGTTTPLSFVQNVLFPISREKLPSFVENNWHDPEIGSVLQTIGTESAEVIRILQTWIDADQKDGRLKMIQGKIWRESFESGAVRSLIYPDVPAMWKEWKNRGIRIYIFSSGSVEAQKLLFQYSDRGDLRGFIDGYFDTTVGAKKSSDSYNKIAQSIHLQTVEMVFLSDVVEEVSAAQAAGMETFLMVREGPLPRSRLRMAQTFGQIVF